MVYLFKENPELDKAMEELCQLIPEDAVTGSIIVRLGKKEIHGVASSLDSMLNENSEAEFEVRSIPRENSGEFDKVFEMCRRGLASENLDLDNVMVVFPYVIEPPRNVKFGFEVCQDFYDEIYETMLLTITWLNVGNLLRELDGSSPIEEGSLFDQALSQLFAIIPEPPNVGGILVDLRDESLKTVYEDFPDSEGNGKLTIKTLNDDVVKKEFSDIFDIVRNGLSQIRASKETDSVFFSYVGDPENSGDNTYQAYVDTLRLGEETEEIVHDLLPVLLRRGIERHEDDLITLGRLVELEEDAQ